MPNAPSRHRRSARVSVRPRLKLSLRCRPPWVASGRLPEWPKGAVCKTVGSAYVGSNPTPATTCVNGPLARNSRLCGPFLLCPVVCHLVALRAAVSRCPRTYSGRRRAAGTVGMHRRLFHGRARTGRAVACSGDVGLGRVSWGTGGGHSARSTRDSPGRGTAPSCWRRTRPGRLTSR